MNYLTNNCCSDSTSCSSQFIDILTIYRQLSIKQMKSFEYALKSLEQINDDVVRYLCTIYRNTSEYDKKFEIRSSLYLIKQLIIESQEQFRNTMSETSLVASNIEENLINNNKQQQQFKLLNNINMANTKMSDSFESTATTTTSITMSTDNQILQKHQDLIESLNKENINLKEQINELQSKLKQYTLNEDDCKAQNKDEEYTRLKDAFEILKNDRKRLKLEKLDLLNQTKELYKTIECKENEIREFLRHYENKTRETGIAVKRLVDYKTEIEKEKLKYQSENHTLNDQINQLKLLVQSKDASIKKLQKQLVEYKSKSPRYSFGKESDYGYASSKSRDTLCNNSNFKLAQPSNINNNVCCHGGVSTEPKDEKTELNNKNNQLTNQIADIYLRESLSSDCIVQKTHSICEAKQINEYTTPTESITYTNRIVASSTLTTSPTTSTSSYSSTTSDDVTSKDLHASLPIMNHSPSRCNNYASIHQNHHILSMSLNIGTDHIKEQSDESMLNKTSATEINIQKSECSINSSSASSSSVILTNSYSSNENSHKVEEHKFTTTIPVDKWQSTTIKEWLESIGMLPIHVKNCLKQIKNGKALLSINDNDLEKIFFLSNPMHKRKIKMALEDLKYPDKCKYKKLGDITNKWICNVWLKDIGLKQYQATFKANLIDGRLLANIQRKDLEKYLGIRKKIHQTSILLGIELLRKYDFDMEHFTAIRQESDNKDITLWTNESFVNWLQLVSLQSYVDNLNESGLHGALITDNSFNADFIYEALRIDETSHQNLRKILEDEIKLLKKMKCTKNESNFVRSVSTIKNDKRLFTFRGSLGRALGRKIKRDISSPLIDDDTYKRLENSHKIVDAKSVNISSAV